MIDAKTAPIVKGLQLQSQHCARFGAWAIGNLHILLLGNLHPVFYHFYQQLPVGLVQQHRTKYVSFMRPEIHHERKDIDKYTPILEI